MSAQPKVDVLVRLDLESNARRLRLQKQTGSAVPQLFRQALQVLETHLASGVDGRGTSQARATSNRMPMT
jgi:hypothetical protein